MAADNHTSRHDDPTGALPPPLSRTRTPSRGESRRRQSTGERINEILEYATQTALQRAQSMDADSLTLIRKKSVHPMAADGHYDDETTGIVSRGSGQSYQTLHIGGGGDTARSRKSTYNTPRNDNGRKPETSALRDDPPVRQQDQDQDSASEGDTTPEPAPPRWKRTLAKFQSLELENTGSVARDHLALERTFLAWLRTSLAFASIGVAVTQLFRLNTSVSEDAAAHGMNKDTLRQMGRPLGTTFLAISILTLLLGCKRYFHAQEWILQGKFPASRGTIIIMAFVALALMLLSLVVVIVIQPEDEK